MASPREAIYTLLSSDATLSGMVNKQFFHGKTPQQFTYPYIRYANASSVPGVLLDGSHNLDDQRWTFLIFGDSCAIVEKIREQLLLVMRKLYTLVTVAAPDDPNNPTAKLLASYPVSNLEPDLDPDTKKWYCAVQFMISFGRY